MNTLRLPRFATALALLLGLFSSFARAAEAGQSVGSVPVPAGLTLAEVKEIAAISLVQRQWTVKEKTDNRVVGYLKHRGIEATLTLTFDTNAIQLFCEGWKINKEGVRQKPELPDGWINNIKKDLAKRLNLATAKK